MEAFVFIYMSVLFNMQVVSCFIVICVFSRMTERFFVFRMHGRVLCVRVVCAFVCMHEVFPLFSYTVACFVSCAGTLLLCMYVCVFSCSGMHFLCHIHDRAVFRMHVCFCSCICALFSVRVNVVFSYACALFCFRLHARCFLDHM